MLVLFLLPIFFLLSFLPFDDNRIPIFIIYTFLAHAVNAPWEKSDPTSGSRGVLVTVFQRNRTNIYIKRLIIKNWLVWGQDGACRWRLRRVDGLSSSPKTRGSWCCCSKTDRKQILSPQTFVQFKPPTGLDKAHPHWGGQSTNLDVDLLQKHLHRHTQKCLISIWKPCVPVKLIKQISHHQGQTLFGLSQSSHPAMLLVTVLGSKWANIQLQANKMQGEMTFAGDCKNRNVLTFLWKWLLIYLDMNEKDSVQERC